MNIISKQFARMGRCADHRYHNFPETLRARIVKHQDFLQQLHFEGRDDTAILQELRLPPHFEMQVRALCVCVSQAADLS